MAIRISCPSCEASLSFDDEKRGKKVRCKKCEEAFTLPASNGKTKTDTALQNGRKLKTKAAAKDDESDDDKEDEQPAKKKKKPAAKKGGNGIFLILGGVAAMLVLICAGAGSLAAWHFLGKKPAIEVPIAIASAPEPKKDPEPPKDIVQAPKDPEPKPGAPLSPELQRVKNATVFISAHGPAGKRYEGSGFLAVEDGVVLTNAHVVGMQDPQAPPPTQIDVIIYPGEQNEVKTQVLPLGIDRSLDLIALRVFQGALPAPLMLEDSAKINEAQPVRIASFPVEMNTRKAFAMMPTTIARLKKAPTGKLDEIQVGGGISRANSGGPVVTAAGMVVGIAGSDDQTRRATSVDVVKRFLDGSVGAATIDKIVKVGKDFRAPVTYQLSDPLKRIQNVRVEIWTGAAGADRPYSYVQPAPLPGDGPHASQALINNDMRAKGQALLPAVIPAGQVVWLQPVIVRKDNSMQWGVATSIVPPAATSPYDLKPAKLIVNLQTPKDRTVKLDAKFKANKGTSAHIQASILETMSPGPFGSQMITAYGNLSSMDAQNVPTPQPTIDLVRQLPTTYVIDSSNKVAQRNYRQLDQKLPKEVKEPALKLAAQLGTVLDAGIIPMPNRTVQPAETWSTNVSVFMRTKQKTGETILVLACTYEGFLVTNGRREAIVTVTGKLQSNNPDFKFAEGNVSGKIGFDEAGGYISSTQLKIANASSFALDIDLQRSAGNIASIQLVQDTKLPAIKNDGKPKVLLNQNGVMAVTGNFDPQFSDLKSKKKRFAHKQDIPIPMQMGKTYTITVTNAAFDSYLKLYGQMGVVAQNGGAGNNSKITYRAPVSGPFVVSVISHNGKLGVYHLHVQESP